MPEDLWKRIQRDRIRRLGLEKDAHLGEPGLDGVGEWLVVDVKCRKRLPKWLTNAVKKAIARAEELKQQDGLTRFPLIVAHEEGEWWYLDLAVTAFGIFLDWFGGESQKAHNLLAEQLAEIIKGEEQQCPGQSESCNG